MKNILKAALIPAMCVSLYGQVFGRIQGTVTTTDGTPVAGAEVELARLDITWVKKIKADAKGAFMQVGLEPKNFKVTVTAPGMAPTEDQIKIPMNDVVIKHFILRTPKEARAEAPKGTEAVAPTPAELKASSGSAALVTALEAYNQQKFAEALPGLEKAVADLNESATTMPEGDARKVLTTQIATAERVYGLTLVEVGKEEPARPELTLKAEPYLAAAYKNNPKDVRYVNGLIEVAKAKHDAEGAKKYQAEADAIIGPRPELAFNEASTAWNAGKADKAMEGVKKAMAMDPKFPDSYYLLGLLELNKGDVKAAKAAWHKYLELAPTGRKAGEVKGYLKELQ